MTVTPAAVNDGNGGANYTVTYKTINTGVISKLAITVTAGASARHMTVIQPRAAHRPLLLTV